MGYCDEDTPSVLCNEIPLSGGCPLAAAWVKMARGDG